MLTLLLALAPQGPTVNPPVLDLNLAPGEVQQHTVQVCLPGETSVALADVFFLADSTGSMGDYINQIQADAAVILGTLLGDPNIDFHIGVGDYKDFPHDPYAFSLAQPITDNAGDINAAISGWSAGGGQDWPEGQLYAIDQIIKDPAISWRPGAKRIILYFGDAPGHDPVCAAISGLGYDITENSIINDLQSAGAGGTTVIAISVGTGLNDPDVSGDYTPACGPSSITPGQADRITAASGGLVEVIGNSAEVTNAILNAIQTVLSEVNVSLSASGAIPPYVTSIQPASQSVTLPDDPRETVCCDFVVTFQGECADDESDADPTGNLELSLDAIPTSISVPTTLHFELCPPPFYEDLGCEEFDRTETLTAADTITLLTRAHNPEHVLGYAFAYAVDEEGAAVAFDGLIGQQLVVDGITSLQHSINAVDFRAGVAAGAHTDLDADDILDLNGSEYESAPGKLLFPRFFGQSSFFDGYLILIGLSGGREFQTTADFLLTNDNEEIFSTEHTFGCWDRFYLQDISAAFSQQFLSTTDHDSEELYGAPSYETGWFSMEGAVASSGAHSIPDPAIYGVYVERAVSLGGADLPFEGCKRSGHLFPRGNFGDNEELDAQGGTDCSGDISRRSPGSLLLFPEFDNRNGVATVFTVTNTDAQAGTDVHFVYLGRYGN